MDSVLRFPVNHIYKACILQLFEQKQARERAQSLLAQHSLRQAFAPPAARKRVEWSALRSTKGASNDS